MGWEILSFWERSAPKSHVASPTFVKSGAAANRSTTVTAAIQLRVRDGVCILSEGQQTEIPPGEREMLCVEDDGLRNCRRRIVKQRYANLAQTPPPSTTRRQVWAMRAAPSAEG